MSVDSPSDTGLALLNFAFLLSPALLHVLAYAAERSPALRRGTLLILGAGDLLALLVGAMLTLFLGVVRFDPDAAIAPGGPLADSAALFAAMGNLGSVIVVAALVGLTLLAAPARRLVARLLPIDPDRVVHVVALHDALLLIVASAAIGLLIPAVLADPAGLEMLADSVESGGLAAVWAQNVAFAILAVFGVGWLVARDGRAVVERLGLNQRPSFRWWLGGVAVALGAAMALDWIWGALAPEQMADVGRLSEALIKPILAYGWAGAATIGVAAGIGEELLFRGAAQPRFGLIATSLLFAVMHTQYTVSPALILIFVLALVLGITRQRAGTWTAIAIHATYNFIIAAQALLSSG